MYTYSVTIGRNIGEIEMSYDSWAEFHRDVFDVLTTAARRHIDTEDPEVWTIEHWSGLTQWQGVPEYSTKFELRSVNALHDYNVADIRNDLEYLREKYAQDAIAFSIGESELITRN
jgi:hypothetical protein